MPARPKTNTAGPEFSGPAVPLSGAAAGAARRYGVTFTSAGSRSAPGPGRPVVALISVDWVRAMQKVVALTIVCPFVPGVPARVMLPPPLVGKQGVSVLLEQQSWAMPPLASMHSPLAFLPTQALPVQVAEQEPPLQLSSCVCGPAESGQGRGPASEVAPVLNFSWMSRVPFGWGLSPKGEQSLDSR